MTTELRERLELTVFRAGELTVTEAILLSNLAAGTAGVAAWAAFVLSRQDVEKTRERLLQREGALAVSRFYRPLSMLDVGELTLSELATLTSERVMPLVEHGAETAQVSQIIVAQFDKLSQSKITH